MYKVSDECRAILDSPDRTTDFYCQVTFPDGSTRRISSEHIKSGTAYVKSKCVSGSDFELGAVCVGEFGVSLLDDNIDSGNYQGAVIRPFCCVRLSDGTFEEIPMGVFNVTEISMPDRHTTKFICYDDMVKFDKEFAPPYGDGSYFSMPVGLWLSQICSSCGVSLSEESLQKISGMSNGNTLMGFAPAAPCNKDIKTYRDVITMITQLLCACALIGRNGELKIINFDRRYSDVYPGYARIINSRQRKSATIKNKKLYDSVSVQLTGLDGELYKHSYPPESSLSNALNIDNNPILRLSQSSVVESYLKEIADRLFMLTYYGAEAEIFSDPTIDAGDHLLLTGGVAGQGVRILVTKNDWTYRGSHKITSDASMIQAKASKHTVSGGGSGDTPVYTDLRNQYLYSLPPVFVTTQQKRLCFISFKPKDFASPVEIAGQICIEMIQSGIVTISSSVDGYDTKIATQQYLCKGTHTIEIMLPINTTEIKTYAVNFYIQCSHGRGESISEDFARANAHIAVRGYFDEPVFKSFSNCITTVNLASVNEVSIPVIDSESSQLGIIEWGDGTSEEYSPSKPYTHSYSEQGDYNITVDCYVEKFRFSGNISSLLLADSVKSIDAGAFAQQSQLSFAYIPPRVKSIGNYAFSGTALKSVYISYDCEYPVSAFPEGCIIRYYRYINDSKIIYTAGDGIEITGDIISLADVITGGTAGQTTAATPAFGEGFSMPWIKFNDKGQIIGSGSRTVVLPSLDTEMSDTSSNAVENKTVKEYVDIKYNTNRTDITALKAADKSMQTDMLNISKTVATNTATANTAKAKAEDALTKIGSGNAAGSATPGGAASSAEKLTKSAGSPTVPVYLDDGVPKVCMYTLGSMAAKNADDYAAKNHTHNYAGSSSSGGPAAIAEKLKTACKINGISFDGTADIKIPRSVKPMARIEGTSGVSGYFKIAHISITGNYVNTPILLSYIQRAGKEATLYICFNSVNNVDPTLAGFRARSLRNQSISAYIHKSAPSTWDIYVKKVEAYDVLFITDCRLRNDGTNIYFDNDQINALPEGAVKAVSAVYLDTDGADAAYLKKSAGGKLLYSGSMSTAGGSLTIPNLADYSSVLLQTSGVGVNGLSCGITALIPISYISKGNSIQLYGGIPNSAYVTSSGVQAAKGMGGYITASMTAGSPTTLTLEQSVGTIGTIQIYSII